MKSKYTLAAILAVWIVLVVAVASGDGFLTPSGPPVPLVIAVAAPLVLFGIGYTQIPWFREALLDLDPRMVLATQLWRVAGGAFLFGWVAGELPGEFAVPAGVGDVATGVAAAFALSALLHGRLTRGGLWAFTALGIGDFLIAIATGIATSPENLDLLPWVLFPTLAVPFFAILHILSLIQLSESGLDHEGKPEVIVSA